ncbi:hypothetical protein Avbf_07392 [Armadillidium vulgare]|nr:hypothetical protein Avbf_06871 [Armadillidium vulgare]RXG62280.1 hypothetical protein Avbf_07392 [Armadillidium vulgare]
MFDVDKFIIFVEQNPPIWDRRTKDYTDRVLRDKCWYLVGENMFDGWMVLTDEAKQEQVKEMKKKWRHIRDSYLKYINQGKHGEPASKKKKYVYADALMFLRQTFVKKNLKNGTEDEDDADMQLQQRDEANVIEATNSVMRLIQQRSGAPEIGTPLKKSNTRKSGGYTSQSKLTEKLESSSSKSDQEDDGDKSFLLSLLPYLKKLNEEQKLDFRLYALQFFRDLRAKNIQPAASFQHSIFPLTQTHHFSNYHSEYQEQSDNYNNQASPEHTYCSSPTNAQQNTSSQSIDINECKVKIEIDDI